MTLQQTLHQPDTPGCGCDASEGLTSVDDAIDTGLSLVRAITTTQCLPLVAATGRVLAESVPAPVGLPLFDNAAMDGYALRSADLAGPGPWALPVLGRSCAGDAPAALPPGGVTRILTGAPVPEGADTVIAQEGVRRRGDGIALAVRPQAGLNIRRAGEDIAAGAPLLPAGVLLGAREIAALAASGVGHVRVARRLRVAVLSSGSELVTPGRPLTAGQIWDANHAMLVAALSLPWIELLPEPACPDDPEALRAAVARLAREADIVLTTGGVSVGDEDHMRRVIAALGGHVRAMKLAMKPGKPLSIGTVGAALWLGLPGNPVAAFVTWHVVGQILARRMAGLSDIAPARSLAALAAPLRHKPGRCEYRLAAMLGHSARGVAQVACLKATGSHRVAQLPLAECLAMIPAEVETLPAGALVEVLPL